MSKRKPEEPCRGETLPFTWEGGDQSDTFDFVFYQVVFTQDFGPFQKGDAVESICVSFLDGFLREYIGGDTVGRETNIKFVATGEITK